MNGYMRASAKHQALHHFVAKAQWSDEALLRQVAQWVVPKRNLASHGGWVVNDTGFPKKGRHSVGVARQYCGVLGKQDNCQVALSVSLASEIASLPVAWQLYLPRAWSEDTARRTKAGVPESIQFRTKTQIALSQLQALLAQGAPAYPVLADAAYGVDSGFRRALSDMGLQYVVGITSAVIVWPPGVDPLAPGPYAGTGRPPVRPRLTAQRQPVSVKELAMGLPDKAFRTVSWREGTNEMLNDRFAAVRVRHEGSANRRNRLAPRQWLLVQWPPGEPAPTKYWLATLAEDTPIERPVALAHQRWRIERDYQDLKQEFGLDHYEGRGWCGFHHHATLCIAAYGFLVAERLTAERTGRVKKTSSNAKCLPFPSISFPAAAQRAQRHVLTSITTLRYYLAISLMSSLNHCPCCGRLARQRI